MPTSSAVVITPDSHWLSDHIHLKQQAQQLSEAYKSGEYIELKSLKSMGSALWEALPGDQSAQIQVSDSTRPTPVIIKSYDAEVLALPWETLYHPEHDFLGVHKQFSISRHYRLDRDDPLRSTAQEPLKILLFTSLPDDLKESHRLEVETEQAIVQQTLIVAEKRGEVILEATDDGRFETFRETLQSFQPHVVYLSGHGSFTHDLAHDRAYGSFLFEDQWGNAQVVEEQDIVGCFDGLAVQLVVLSACLSASQHPHYPDNGLSMALYRSGIPHVIGMPESILDFTGIQWAGAFIEALINRQPIDAALQSGRHAILEEPLTDAVLLPKEITSLQWPLFSKSQWCLPQLLSHDLQHPLIDWSFTPQPRTFDNLKNTLGFISIPKRFVGRRRELRQWQHHLHEGEITQLLITGAGGMGKTALASKLMAGLQKTGYQAFTFSLRPEHDWVNALSVMQQSLTQARVERYQHTLQQLKKNTLSTDDTLFIEASKLLKLLLEQNQNKLLLFFDNLESVQQKERPYPLKDHKLQAWIDAARQLSDQGLILILTSRWRLPDWPQENHYPLGSPIYGDYLAFARQQSLPLSFLGNRSLLKKAYNTLGGNFRALELFAQVCQNMGTQEEWAFLEKLQGAEAEIQVDMALAELVSRCTSTERTLLNYFLAYQVAVPLAGIVRLVEKQPLSNNPAQIELSGQVQALLNELLSVSLLEQQHDAKRGEDLYQLAPLVRSWLEQEADTPPVEALLLQTAAQFLLWQLEEDHKTSWEHRLATHQALQQAGLDDFAHRLVLDWIEGPLNNAGLYQILIDKWLPTTLQSTDPQTQSEALGQMGKQYLYVGGYSTALQYLKQSLAIQQKIEDQSGESSTLNNISQIYDACGDYDTALQYLNQSLKIQQKIGDQSEGATLNNISQIFKARGDYDTALQYLKQSLKIRREISDKPGESSTLNSISQIYDARGDYKTALRYLKQSLAIQQEIGDELGKSTTLNNISQICDALGDYDTAFQYLKQSLKIKQEIGDKFGEGTTLNNISLIFKVRGDYDTALRYLKQSLAIQQEIGDKSGKGTTLNNISLICKARGDYDTALHYNKQSLAIAQEIGDKSGEGITLNNISQIYDARGDYDTALQYLKQSLAIQQEIGDKSGEGTTLNNISLIYDARGDYDTALQYLRRSLAIRQIIGDKLGESTTINNMATIAYARGDYDTALQYLKQSLTIQQEIGDKPSESTTLNNISLIYDERGDYDTALHYNKQSLAIAQEIGDKSGEGITLNNISQIYDARGDYDTALHYLKQSLAITQEIGDEAGLCTTLFNMGHIHLQNEEVSEALQAWVTVYRLAKPMNLAQALEALEGLPIPEQLGLPKGLEGWEALAQRFEQEE